MKTYLSMIFLALLSLKKGYSEERIESPLVKVYTSPESIFLSSEGVFHVNHCNEFSPVQFVASDTFGLYVVGLKNFYKCPSCGRYNSNNICYNKKCPMYLK